MFLQYVCLLVCGGSEFQDTFCFLQQLQVQVQFMFMYHFVVFYRHWCCISICFHKVSSSTSILTLYEETTPISKLIVPMENNLSSKVNI